MHALVTLSLPHHCSKRRIPQQLVLRKPCIIIDERRFERDSNRQSDDELARSLYYLLRQYNPGSVGRRNNINRNANTALTSMYEIFLAIFCHLTRSMMSFMRRIILSLLCKDIWRDSKARNEDYGNRRSAHRRTNGHKWSKGEEVVVITITT